MHSIVLALLYSTTFIDTNQESTYVSSYIKLMLLLYEYNS